MKVQLPKVKPLKQFTDCEWCGAMDAPENLSWKTRIAPENEPGEPLILQGTIYEPDGTTPAKGIVVYAYNTNAQGIYPKRGDESGNCKRHGYLRGWAITNEKGNYQFTTIKSALEDLNRKGRYSNVISLQKNKEGIWIGKRDIILSKELMK